MHHIALFDCFVLFYDCIVFLKLLCQNTHNAMASMWVSQPALPVLFLRCWGIFFTAGLLNQWIVADCFLQILFFSAVFHGCGKGNEEGVECLLRWGGRIALNTAHLSRSLQVVIGTLLQEEKTTLLNSVSRERPQVISPCIFNLHVVHIIFMIMMLGITTN